jgi:hypothetical protein
VRYAAEAKAAAAYFYEGTTDGSGVLKNKRDIRDARSLELTERAMVTAQAKNLPASIDLFSYNGFKELHRHLFGKLYEWAGRERNYTTGRDAASFARPEYMGSWMEKQQIKALLTELRGASARMKAIALIDTRSEIPGVSLGTLVSTHPDMMAAFAGNDAFQKAEASGRHIRTKIVTLKNRLDVGQPVQAGALGRKQINFPEYPSEEAEQIAADL